MKKSLYLVIVLILAVTFYQQAGILQAQEPGEEIEEIVVDTAPAQIASHLQGEGKEALLFAIAASISLGCIAAAFAVAKIGAAAMGAAAEKPEIMGRALLFVGLAEGIAIYGLIIAVMLYMKL